MKKLIVSFNAAAHDGSPYNIYDDGHESKDSGFYSCNSSEPTTEWYIRDNKFYFKHEGYSGFTEANPTELANGFISKIREAQNKKGINMLKEVSSDVRDFVKEHRGVFYTVACIFLVDHFFLNGSLRERLKAFFEKALSKAEAKLDKS